jgi:cytochrome c-type biogenesis protein CcmE
MSLDEELARAAANETDLPPVVTRPLSDRSAPPPKGNVKLLVGLLVVAGGIVGLVMSFQEAAVYAKTVDQLVAEKTKMAGRAVRVEGDLVKGSLERDEKPCEYRFRMTSPSGAEIPVRYANCVVPDTFRDVPGMDVKVTVEGKLGTDGRFEATQVMAKCPSKYEMKDKASRGEQAPHDPMNR